MTHTLPTGVSKAMTMKKARVKELLELKTRQYNHRSFIEADPICIPHLFSHPQDIEIAGFLAAVFAWGKRITIIRKSRELMERMDMAPYQFVVGHQESDLHRLSGFVHRTFNDTDLLYFIRFLHHHYHNHASLETAFVAPTAGATIAEGLSHFHRSFFSLDDYPPRTKKHIPTPDRNSTCKRLCMFLRWMVRRDQHGVDFGLWSAIRPSQLVCPCDVHVERVARKLKLIKRKQSDWATALELTSNLRKMDPEDPVKYDFALFALGVIEGW